MAPEEARQGELQEEPLYARIVEGLDELDDIYDCRGLRSPAGEADDDFQNQHHAQSPAVCTFNRTVRR